MLRDSLEKNIKMINSVCKLQQCKLNNVRIITGPLTVRREESEELTTQMVLPWTLKGQQNFFWERKNI